MRSGGSRGEDGHHGSSSPRSPCGSSHCWRGLATHTPLMRMPALMRWRRELTQPNTGGTMARALVALALLALAGCTITRDIKLRAPDGTEVKCEGVTGIYGLRSHTLLNVQ